MKPLLLAIPELGMGAQHDLQVPCQVFFAEQLGHARHPRALVARNLQQGRVLPSDLSHRGITQKAHKLSRKVGGIVPFVDQLIDCTQHFLARTP